MIPNCQRTTVRNLLFTNRMILSLPVYDNTWRPEMHFSHVKQPIKNSKTIDI